MIRLYEGERHAKSADEALMRASCYTGFDKNDFKCEEIEPPKRIGFFKKEDGLYYIWYEYQGMDAHKELTIVDAHLYVDTVQKKILVLRDGYKSYEIDYSDLIDYEMVIASSTQTRTISSKNKALKGAVLYGITGAIIGAADSETISSIDELAEVIIRLRFKNKKPFEILTMNYKYNVENEDWRDVLDQSKIADKFFRELLEEMNQ